MSITAERLLPKFLTVDPGEDTGWSIWDDRKLLDSGTTKMWDFGDAVWEVALSALGGGYPPPTDPIAVAIEGIDLIVCEDWRLYPWEAMAGNLNWDECRTARLIGSLYQAARFADWKWEVQPAAIKERAEAAGAEVYFSHPLNENRHANDAIRHGVFRIAQAQGASWTDLSKHEFIIENSNGAIR